MQNDQACPKADGDHDTEAPLVSQVPDEILRTRVLRTAVVVRVLIPETCLSSRLSS